MTLTSTPPRYADWKAPSQDADFLIWPTGNELIQQTRGNLKSLCQSESLIQNAPLRELRAAASPVDWAHQRRPAADRDGAPD